MSDYMNDQVLKEFEARLAKGPSLGEGVYIAPNATVIGEVYLADDSSVWHGAIVRGDVAPIYIGRNSNVQDGSVLHVAHEKPVVMGENVTVGHNVNLHGCAIGDNSLVGIGAIVLDGAFIDKNTIVAAGTLVPPNKRFPPNVMLLGNPAKVSRELTEDDLDMISRNASHYLKYKDVYLRIIYNS